MNVDIAEQTTEVAGPEIPEILAVAPLQGLLETYLAQRQTVLDYNAKYADSEGAAKAQKTSATLLVQGEKLENEEIRSALQKLKDLQRETEELRQGLVGRIAKELGEDNPLKSVRIPSDSAKARAQQAAKEAATVGDLAAKVALFGGGDAAEALTVWVKAHPLPVVGRSRTVDLTAPPIKRHRVAVSVDRDGEFAFKAQTLSAAAQTAQSWDKDAKVDNKVLAEAWENSGETYGSKVTLGRLTFTFEEPAKKSK